MIDSLTYNRTTYAFFIALFCALVSQAQNCAAFKQVDFVTHPDVLFLERVVEGTFSKTPVPQETPKPLVVKDWLATDWITTRFNPYDTVQTQFPFQLQFKDSTFASPVLRKKVVTSHFGWRKGAAHKGIDIDLWTGDKVLAMLDGKVRYVKWHSAHGNVVVIRHNSGLETVYAHLSKQLIQVNDSVKKGQVIGRGGVTGNARGSHLHLEVRFQGICINPEYIFDFGVENRIRASEIWVNKNWSQAHLFNHRKIPDIHVCHSLKAAEALAGPPVLYHTIRQGDTLSSISHKYQVSVRKLCKTNQISQKTLLRIGQKLSIN